MSTRINPRAEEMPEGGAGRNVVPIPRGNHTAQRIPIDQAVQGFFWYLLVCLLGTMWIVAAGVVHVLAGAALWLVVLRPLALWLLPRFTGEESRVDYRPTLRLVWAAVLWTVDKLRRSSVLRSVVRRTRRQSGNVALTLVVRVWIGALAVLSILFLAPNRWGLLGTVVAVVALLLHWSSGTRSRRATVDVRKPCGRRSADRSARRTS
jgi:hypothetical protein